MSRTIKILGISGSLRQASLNTSLVRAAGRALITAHPTLHFSLTRLHDLPLFNEDVQIQHGFPMAVQQFRKELEEADGFVFGCPEYNYSVSGVLKNAIDWGSRVERERRDAERR